MSEAKKRYLLEVIDRELTDKVRRLELAKKTNREYAEITMGSWSANGDRAVAEQITDMQYFALSQTEKLRREITDTDARPKNTISPPCWVQFISNGLTKEIYLVRSGAKIPGIILVGPDSLLGRALEGKRVGEDYSYQSQTKIVGGRILSVD